MSTTLPNEQFEPAHESPHEPIDDRGQPVDHDVSERIEDGEKRPTSTKQVAANQRNAKKSTGPRTNTGKARSAFNAMTHGVYSRSHPIERGVLAEDEEDVTNFVNGLIDDLEPRDTQELAVARRIAEGELRLARADRYESVGLSAAGRLTKHQKDQGWGSEDDYLNGGLAGLRAQQLLSGSIESSDKICWYDAADLLWSSLAIKQADRRSPINDGTTPFDDLWRNHVLGFVVPQHWASLEDAIESLGELSTVCREKYVEINGKAEESAVEKALAPGGVMDRASILRTRTRKDLERDRATYEKLRQRDFGEERDDE